MQKIAVIGDLHYEPPQEPLYRAARAQFRALAPDTVFQLGDQGGYSHCGSWQSFMEGLEFLSALNRPFHTLIGNHDLEGADYGSDEEAVDAWCRAFERRQPYYAVDLGETLAICLSSTRFRSNPGCSHEVHVDRAQIAWLRATLAANRERPTFLFSHAPPLGAGIRVLQSIHLKCPNAWLNHTDHPEQFIQLVHANPQIKLWFSAHNHLGQMYGDSIARVGQCTFVHTGVIGEVSRDGCHQSRLVEFDRRGLVLLTVDHTTGQTMPNVRCQYASGAWELLSDCIDAQPSRAIEHFSPPTFPQVDDRLECGTSVFAVHRGMLVEYDLALEAPVGVVMHGVTAQMVRVAGGQLEIMDQSGRWAVIEREWHGRYFRIFEPNPLFLRMKDGGGRPQVTAGPGAPGMDEETRFASEGAA